MNEHLARVACIVLMMILMGAGLAVMCGMLVLCASILVNGFRWAIGREEIRDGAPVEAKRSAYEEIDC